MRYIDYLSKTDNFDKYVLFLLDITLPDGKKFSAKDVAGVLGVSRQAIYDVKKRNEDLLKGLGVEVENDVFNKAA